MNLYKSLAEQLAAALRPVTRNSKSHVGGHMTCDLSGQDIVNAFIALSDYDFYTKEPDNDQFQAPSATDSI